MLFCDIIARIMSISMNSPADTQLLLANAAKQARLAKNWRVSTLAERAGIPEGTLKRFERTGEISLRQFLMLVHTLGDPEPLTKLFLQPLPGNIVDIARPQVTRKRGTS